MRSSFWERRNVPLGESTRGNALTIAQKVYEYELGITKDKRKRLRGSGILEVPVEKKTRT